MHASLPFIFFISGVVDMQGFKRHVKKDHNMWAYVYFSIYLDQIDVTNHNAIEKYVYEKVLGT